MLAESILPSDRAHDDGDVKSLFANSRLVFPVFSLCDFDPVVGGVCHRGLHPFGGKLQIGMGGRHMVDDDDGRLFTGSID